VIPDISHGLRDVRVKVPKLVKNGYDAKLICNYDLEGDTLYSVKWYKDGREICRYVPSDYNPIRCFSNPDIQVDVSASYRKVKPFLKNLILIGSQV
jgi:hypothetical protein